MTEAGKLAAIRALVEEQAEDEALWFRAETSPEAYLQKALRRLHAAIEGESIREKKQEGGDYHVCLHCRTLNLKQERADAEQRGRDQERAHAKRLAELYGACARIAKEMGFDLIEPTILDSEPGTSWGKTLIVTACCTNCAGRSIHPTEIAP